MATAPPPFVFVIEEATGTDRIRVELKDHDVPFGRPRKGGAFKLGGPVNIDDVMLDGRTTPIIHTKQADHHPTVVKGHLRDHFSAQDGHAHSIRESLERIRNRMRPLTLSIWQLKWTAFMKEATFEFEGANDLPYELHFRVLKGPTTKVSVFDNARILAPVDLMANARAVLASRQAAFLALAMARYALISIRTAFNNVDAALSNAQVAARSFEQTPKRADQQSRALVSAAQTAKVQAAALAATVLLYDPSVLKRASAGNSALFKSMQIGTVADALDLQISLLNAQTTALARIRKATKLYQVGQGDTKESIASSQLGNASRASELGIRPQDLVVGKFIRIPTVT